MKEQNIIFVFVMFLIGTSQSYFTVKLAYFCQVSYNKIYVEQALPKNNRMKPIKAVILLYLILYTH